MESHTQKKLSNSSLIASTADPFKLYIEAVQDPTEVASFINQLYLKHNGRLPQTIREDFCGTAMNCVEWIKSNDSGIAIAVDLDSEPLKWCQERLLTKLEVQDSNRLQLIQDDALIVETPKIDVILGLNSSVFYFKQRKQLLQYFKNCYRHLNSDALIILEIYGGPEAMVTGNDRLEFKEFTYIWEQETFNSVSNETKTHLHFEFPDGSRLERAFTYDYRLWSISEIMDALNETGFVKSEVYMITEKHGQRKSIPTIPSRYIEVTDHWSAYIIGRV